MIGIDFFTFPVRSALQSPSPSRQASCTTPSASGSLTPSTPPPDLGGNGYGLKRPSSGSINGADDMRARSSSGSGGERRHSREDGSDSSKDSR